MSMHLKHTSSNLNKSVFFDDSHRFILPQGGYSVNRDSFLLRQIITPQHIHNLTNFCFDNCVNTFSSSNFSSEESVCLNVCKTDALNSLYSFDTLTQ